MHPDTGYLVVAMLAVCIIAWYWWATPHERELVRELTKDQLQHLWENVKSGAQWVKQKYQDYRAKKA